MKKLFGVLAAAALSAAAGSAMAEGGQGAQQQGQQGQQYGQQGQQGNMQKGQQGQQAQKQAAAGSHQVEGRIVDIDKKDGTLKVQTDKGQLEFQFPPASVQGLNQGDEVRLDVSIRKAPKGTEQQPQKK
jgi:opacity protein-like surface antigen